MSGQRCALWPDSTGYMRCCEHDLVQGTGIVRAARGERNVGVVVPPFWPPWTPVNEETKPGFESAESWCRRRNGRFAFPTAGFN